MHKLITNNETENFYNKLTSLLYSCESFYFNVAFINYSGLQLLLDTFSILEEKGISGKILTSTYLNFTDPKALKRIMDFKNIDLNIHESKNGVGFHSKAYIFEFKDYYKIIIGSSNITQSALKSNIEWNLRIQAKSDDEFTLIVKKEYDSLWNQTSRVDEKFLNEYSAFLNELKKEKRVIEFKSSSSFRPNSMQEKATKRLSALRKQKQNKALIIAATGSGKTYLAAYDVKMFKAKKVLFLVHIENILLKAKDAFEIVINDKNITMGILSGTKKEISSDYLFSTVQTMNKVYSTFEKDEFDYIIVDEAHHITSSSYLNIINHFKPKFLLGMTATPERCDGANIYEIFDNNKAIDIRLREALEDDLVVPFHYFGIEDIKSIDYSNVKLNNISELASLLKVNSRVEYIIEKMNFYGHDGEKSKTIAFCVNKDHAFYMAEEFNNKGIKSLVLTGEDSISAREIGIKELEDDNKELEVIFTVDIFNEGIDIPSINRVLLLRPTNSPIIFIQQLGRGLRKCEDKEYLTVLDFIGNHNKAYLIAIALMGKTGIDKDSIVQSVKNDFSSIPGATHIQMDAISKERILKQIEEENFNSIKYLKDEYFEFKNILNNKVPKLLDYLSYDGSVNPIKFISYSKSYIEFLAKVENNDFYHKYFVNEEFIKIIRFIDSLLPIKRIHEFVILKHLINNENISIPQAKESILQYVNNHNVGTIEHSFDFLSQVYFDSREKKTYIQITQKKDNKLYRTEVFSKILENDDFKSIILDSLNYGILLYESEFSSINYGLPAFKINYKYNMKDVALLCNYTKIHSSFRGAGVLKFKNDYFLFVNLEKDQDIKESINYKNKFLSLKHFQWQSKNSTSQDSDEGFRLTKNKEAKYNLHLFVRKYKVVDKKIELFTYLGKANTISFKDNKPITLQLELENEISMNLFEEFKLENEKL